MAIDLARVKGLCFDVDGTLSDTDDAWVERLSVFCSYFKFFFRHADPKPFARWLVMATESPMNGIYHLADQLSLDDNFARLYSRLSQKRKTKAKRFLLMKGTIELLDLVGSRYPLSVVSARDETSTLRFLDQFDLTHRFQVVVTSQTCEHTKPFPDPILYAAQSMEVPAENCLMIGDTTVDILAGRAAGAQTAGLLCGFGMEKELRRAGVDQIFSDLLDFRQFFAD